MRRETAEYDEHLCGAPFRITVQMYHLIESVKEI